MKMRYFWPPLATNNTLTCNGRNNKTNFLVTKLMSYSERQNTNSISFKPIEPKYQITTYIYQESILLIL